MRSDRLILLILPLLALGVGFYVLVISPKREEASELAAQIEQLETSIQAAESQIAAAEQARDAFPRNYGTLVELGRAVPDDNDQATLIYDLAQLAGDNDVNFRDFAVAQASTAPAPAAVPTDPAPADPAAPAQPDAPADPDIPAAPATPAPATPTTAAPPGLATEATAATLPIGASIGQAGLPVMPYDFRFRGGFFDIADFFADVDGMVSVKRTNGKPVVEGRLMTIDGFKIVEDVDEGFPAIEAEFQATTYVVPEAQGVTAGATPAGPAPSVPGQPGTVASAQTPAPAAGVTP